MLCEALGALQVAVLADGIHSSFGYAADCSRLGQFLWQDFASVGLHGMFGNSRVDTRAQAPKLA